MEINTQNMEALLHLQETQAQLPRKQQGTAFDSILNQQLNADPAVPGLDPALSRLPGMYGPIMVENPEQSEALDSDSAVLMEAFNQASGTLDMWDSYLQTLGNPTSQTALRDAWGLLQGIDAQVTQMRTNPSRSRSPELDAILNELEVLTATEKFKFNRGDYI